MTATGETVAAREPRLSARTGLVLLAPGQKGRTEAALGCELIVVNAVVPRKEHAAKTRSVSDLGIRRTVIVLMTAAANHHHIPPRQARKCSSLTPRSGNKRRSRSVSRKPRLTWPPGRKPSRRVFRFRVRTTDVALVIAPRRSSAAAPRKRLIATGQATGIETGTASGTRTEIAIGLAATRIVSVTATLEMIVGIGTRIVS